MFSFGVDTENLANFGFTSDCINDGWRKAVTELPRDVVDEMVDDIVREDCDSFLACVDNNFRFDGEIEADNIT